MSIKMTLLRYVGVVAMFFCVGAIEKRQGPGRGVLMPDFFPPAVPLVVVDPYLSIWSAADNLYDTITTHWSGSPMKLSGMITIDNKTYRYMSKDNNTLPNDTMKQVNLTIYPTQTVYVFQVDQVQLTLTFSTPALTNTGNVPTLPMTILTYNVESLDGRTHNVKLYYDNTGEGTVDSEEETMNFTKLKGDGEILRVEFSAGQPLSESTDLINWGYWYVYTPTISGVRTTVGSGSVIRQAFIDGKELPSQDTFSGLGETGPVIAVAWDLGAVTSAEVYLEILYDQIDSIKYFGTSMSPLWRHEFNNDITQLTTPGIYNDVKKDCNALDIELINDLYAKGGSEYATVTSLVWRQAVGATQSVWNDVIKEHWMFMKEISSDGDVSTVDVVYPASPMFLYKSPDSLRRMLIPILEYASNKAATYGESIKYDLPYAPHHLGTWPICNLLQSQQEQMPVEESGNMICMIAGIVKQTNYDITFIQPYWKLIKKWADYLVKSLPDPGNQLCTDDFEGPSPHNVNLALKGIVALGAYSYLLKLNNQSQEAEYYDQHIKGYVQYWMTNASDGDHYRLQYNLPNTWSLKYNLLFQAVLGLDVFPETVIMKEEAFYQSKMEKYGVPLDNRNTYTKCDWMMWIAAMGSDDQFQALTKALFQFALDTPDRIPFTDWYYTDTAEQRGFKARPVVGGFYAKMIMN